MSAKKKTVLRTIRISEDIDVLLERDAQEKNISANSLISKIMVQYVEWDRIVEKIGSISVSHLLFRALINEISDEKLEEVARDFAVKEVKNIAMWSFGKTDFDSLLKALFLIGKYSISAPLSVEVKVDNQYIISLHHDWGTKGVVFFKSFLSNFVRNELGMQPTIGVTKDIVTASFPKPAKPFL
jgi:hypothetical protein